MAGYLPPAPSPFFPPPPPHSRWSRQLYTPAIISVISGMPPTPTGNNTVSAGAVVGAVIGAVAFLVVVILLMRCCNSRSANAAAHAATAAAALPARPQAPPQPDYWDDNNDEHWLRHHRSDRDGSGGTQRASSPTADLPSFTYNREVRHNVTGSGDEAATCSVCLGAFQVGETVRLLPVCLHLYHVECIDPWLEAHSTCPICRLGTDDDPTMHGGLPPV